MNYETLIATINSLPLITHSLHLDCKHFGEVETWTVAEWLQFFSSKFDALSIGKMYFCCLHRMTKCVYSVTGQWTRHQQAKTWLFFWETASFCLFLISIEFHIHFANLLKNEFFADFERKVYRISLFTNWNLLNWKLVLTFFSSWETISQKQI